MVVIMCKLYAKNTHVQSTVIAPLNELKVAPLNLYTYFHKISKMITDGGLEELFGVKRKQLRVFTITL